jgi:signal transduction histidine kinase
VYAGVVIGVGAGIGAGGNALLSAVAAAIVALAFQPVRRWAQRLANRLVYGRRATPYQVLSEFADRLSESYSVDDVLPRLTRLVAEGTGASEVSVWLGSGEGLRAITSWPTTRPSGPAASIGQLAGRVFEVRHQGSTLGAIAVSMPANDPLTPEQERLVSDVASQAGLVLRNVRLVEELRESRRRIVAAQDARAKKLERDIHDGAQQQLVALSVKQRLAASLIGRDDDRARSVLDELHAETTDALENLRDIARGIYPPLLADQGLPAALEAQARKSPVHVVVDRDSVGRYPQEVESAVYFCALEALQNIAKYSAAVRATIRLEDAGSELRFDIGDDGVGFDPVAARGGTGLQGMADRIEAVAGSLEIRSAPGEGTIGRRARPDRLTARRRDLRH